MGEGLLDDTRSSRVTNQMYKDDEDILSEVPMKHGVDVAMIVPVGGGYPARQTSDQDNVNQDNTNTVKGNKERQQRSSSYRFSSRADDLDELAQEVLAKEMIDEVDALAAVSAQCDGSKYNGVANAQNVSSTTVWLGSTKKGSSIKNDVDVLDVYKDKSACAQEAAQEEEQDAKCSLWILPEEPTLGKSQERDDASIAQLVPAAPTSRRPSQPSFRRRFLKNIPGTP